MAHKKAAGSSENLKDSQPKYRGVKLFAGQTASAGNIIIRQKGDKYQAGVNVYKGKDFTLHAMTDGIVFFRKKKMTKYDGRVYLETVVDILSAELIAQKNAEKAALKAKAAQPKVKKIKVPKAQAPKAPAAKKTAAPKAEKPAAAKKAPAPKAEKPAAAKKAPAPKAEKPATAKKPAAKKAAA